MQHISQLLALENSELSKLLRFSLYGIEAALTQARIVSPQDPGAAICDQVLQEIHDLLQPPTPTFSPPDSPVEFKLTQLRTAFESDPELNLYLGNTQLHSQTDSDLWHEIQRKLLRLPEDLATSWQQRALELAANIGAKADNSHLYQLPFIRDEVIYPGLNGTVKTQGLCLSPKALLDANLNQNYESKELYALAGFVNLLIKFIAIDPDLHHALKSVFSFDVISFQSKPEQQTQYIDALIDRLQRTCKAEANADPLTSLRAWIDVDEAIHSLVFVPPAARYSWWGKLQQESRRMLKKVVDRVITTGNDVRIRQLSGLYADICALTKDDLQLDCGGAPGEVLTCIRVYARINQEDLPGRVLFRSLR